MTKSTHDHEIARPTVDLKTQAAYSYQHDQHHEVSRAVLSRLNAPSWPPKVERMVGITPTTAHLTCGLEGSYPSGPFSFSRFCPLDCVSPFD